VTIVAKHGAEFLKTPQRNCSVAQVIAQLCMLRNSVHIRCCVTDGILIFIIVVHSDVLILIIVYKSMSKFLT
jgi:hypothetical protein